MKITHSLLIFTEESGPATKRRGVGGGGLRALPLRKENFFCSFFAASLRIKHHVWVTQISLGATYLPSLYTPLVPKVLVFLSLQEIELFIIYCKCNPLLQIQGSDPKSLTRIRSDPVFIVGSGSKLWVLYVQKSCPISTQYRNEQDFWGMQYKSCSRYKLISVSDILLPKH